MAVFEDFSRAVTDLGFIWNPLLQQFLHPTDTIVVFIPTESAYTKITETAFQIVVHEDIWRSKRNAVINRLIALTGNTKRIHGRQCTVKRIDSITSQDFLDQFHTAGFVNSYFKYGLFFKDEIVAVGLFSKCRTFQSENHQSYKSAELTRYACKTGIRIAGGLDKLLNAFCEEIGVSHLMTYADKEWTNGKSYFTLGFKKVADTPPLLFWVSKETGQRIPANINDIELNSAWVSKSNLGNIKLIRIKNPRN